MGFAKKLEEAVKEIELERIRKVSEIDYTSFPCKPTQATKIRNLLENKLHIFTYKDLTDCFDLDDLSSGKYLDINNYKGFGKQYTEIIRQHLANIKYLSQVSKLILKSSGIECANSH